MKRLLISCDDYLFRYNGRYYFKDQVWKDFYDRYLRVFDSIRLCNRVIEENELDKSRILIENPRIEINHLPVFHGPFQYLSRYVTVGRAMKSATAGCDAAILRLPSTVAQRLSRRVLNSGIPYAVEVVFDAHDGAKNTDGIINKLVWSIIDWQMRRTCRKADGVACVTEHYLQRRYFSIKPNHFTEHYSTLALNKAFYTGPRIFPTKPRLTVAHIDMQIGLNSRKGTKEVIDAVALLKNRGITIDVKFAGDDWDTSTQMILDYASQRGIRAQVSCPGFLSRERLSDFLDSTDLFVLPTKAEGLPRVIIEAMAKGLPVVTSPVSGNPELISPDYMVDYSDVEKLADKIEALVTSSGLYERASRENYYKSLEYESSLLEKRRDWFYSQLYSI